MANWTVQKGYLWKLTGKWENEFRQQCEYPCYFLGFWQDSESEYGSYILVFDDIEFLPVNWGCSQVVDIRKYQNMSILDSRPLLDCDERGCGAYILEADSDGEVTVLVRW